MRAIALKSKSNVTCIFFVHLGHTTNSRSLRRVHKLFCLSQRIVSKHGKKFERTSSISIRRQNREPNNDQQLNNENTMKINSGQ